MPRTWVVFYRDEDGNVPLLDWAHIRGALAVARKRKPTTDALEIMHRWYFVGRPDRLARLEEELANAEVARKIYDLRKKAGLTQQRLAALVGTTASVISRLEDADYAGHSLSMLRRIAAALDRRVEIRFVMARKEAAPAKNGRARVRPAGRTTRRSRPRSAR